MAGVAKVIFNNRTLVDVTQDTVSSGTLLAGTTALSADGEVVEGSAQVDRENEILEGTLGGVYLNGALTKVGQYGLASVGSNQTEQLVINLPNATQFDPYAFYDNTKLVSITAPKLISTGMCGFRNCSALTSFSSDTLLSLGASTNWNTCQLFENCTNLVSVDCPQVGWNGAVRHALFQGCSKLTNINLPLCTALGGPSIFRNCTSLPCLVLPSYGSNQWVTGTGDGYGINSTWFENDSSLEYLDIKNPYNIQANAFKNCSKLDTLIFRGDRVPALSNVSAFTGTPFASGGSGGTIYITQEMYNHLDDGTALDYKSATNWATIQGYGTITWEKIEGSYYETHYGDGRLISEVVLPYPKLISLNGSWDYGNLGTITVTNGNHITLVAKVGYGGADIAISRQDGKPIFTIPCWSKVTLVHPTASELSSNGRVTFCKQDGSSLRALSDAGSFEYNFQTGTDCVDIYSVKFRKYHTGTIEYDFELLLNDIRII